MDQSKLTHLMFQIQVILLVITYLLLGVILFHLKAAIWPIAIAPVVLLIALYWKALLSIEGFVKAEFDPTKLLKFGAKGVVAYFLVCVAFVMPIVMASLTSGNITYANDPDYDKLVTVIPYIALASCAFGTLIEYYKFRKRSDRRKHKSR